LTQEDPRNSRGIINEWNMGESIALKKNMGALLGATKEDDLELNGEKISIRLFLFTRMQDKLVI
jgi:hypothetical protein